ncbi:uncharacterized protein FSUBG_2239 [Fusarium subglutinans]|uniref:Uncharacterized protein n=1 Tax=Gibberella subglutinans TaxID=42677 RepID=A0A8H5QBC5_GIBSU|nr:uncharacterized protein FSUBG_2239 [Fusarium subglutinans]KAF5611407.1 hypothetical protein FSUBG_2239 [Fusarium subglutinans]
MANESAPAEGHTVTLSITREQALARVGEVIRQLRDASVGRKSFKPQMERLMDFHTFSERIQRFEGVLNEDISQISWKHQLPGEPIDKQDEGLAASPMKVLADILYQLKGTDEQLKGTQAQLRGTQAQLRGTQEQLKETLVHADREKLKFQKSAPQEIVDDFKTIYAQYGMAIPRELLNIAGYILTPDQHKQALAARDTEIMADA